MAGNGLESGLDLGRGDYSNGAWKTGCLYKGET
jgi:hypothetical protein